MSLKTGNSTKVPASKKEPRSWWSPGSQSMRAALSKFGRGGRWKVRPSSAPSTSQGCAHPEHDCAAVFRSRSEKLQMSPFQELGLCPPVSSEPVADMGLHSRQESQRTPSPRFPAWLQAALGLWPRRPTARDTHNAHSHAASSRLATSHRKTPNCPHLSRADQLQHREPCIPETGTLGQAVCMDMGIANAESHPGSAPV